MQSAGWKKIDKKLKGVNIKMVVKLWPNKEQDLLKDMRLDGDLPACNSYLFPPSHKQRQESLFHPLQPGLLLYWHRDTIKQQGKSSLMLWLCQGWDDAPRHWDSESMWKQTLRPWRNSYLEDLLLDAWILCWKHIELLGYKSFRQLSWVFRCWCQPSGAPQALMGCSHRPAAARWECTCQLVHGRGLDCFLLGSRSLHIQISLLPHWQVVERAGYDGSAVFSSLPGRHGDGNCFVGLDESRDGGWREEWTHCEDHKLSSFSLCSSNNFINITSAISAV